MSDADRDTLRRIEGKLDAILQALAAVLKALDDDPESNGVDLEGRPLPPDRDPTQGLG